MLWLRELDFLHLAIPETDYHRRVISQTPIELVFLHVRPIDLSQHSAILLGNISTKKAWLAVARILIHRYLATGYDASEADAFVTFFEEIMQICPEGLKDSLKNVLFGAGGRLLKAFGEITEGYLITSEYFEQFVRFWY